MKIVASICLEAAGKEWFSTTYMVKDGRPDQRAKDLRGGTVGVVASRRPPISGACRIAQRRHRPDRTPRSFRWPSPEWATRCHRQDQRRDLRRALYSAELPGAACARSSPPSRPSATTRAARYLVRRQVPKENPPDAVRAFLADYVAVTKYYLAIPPRPRVICTRAGSCATPLEIYLKNADWKRDPNARVDVASLERLSKFMLEKLRVPRSRSTSPRWSTRATCRADPQGVYGLERKARTAVIVRGRFLHQQCRISDDDIVHVGCQRCASPPLVRANDFSPRSPARHAELRCHPTLLSSASCRNRVELGEGRTHGAWPRIELRVMLSGGFVYFRAVAREFVPESGRDRCGSRPQRAAPRRGRRNQNATAPAGAR